MEKMKSVGGKDYPASAFAYVGNPDDTSTWHLPIPDADHVRAALARFDQTDLPADAKAGVVKKLLAAAKRFGVDASGFASEHGAKTSEAGSAKFGVFNTETDKQVGDSFASEEAARHKCATLIKENGDHYSVKRVKEASGESYEEQMAELDQALLDSFGLDTGGYRRFMLVETFPDYVIARGPDGELYQIDYTDDETSDDIKFGEPQEVETAYVPVQQSARFLASEAAAETDGWSWPVQIMESGWAHGSVNGQEVPHYFPASVVAQVAEAANQQRFRRRHPREDEGTGADLPELTAGWTSECRMQGTAAVGKVNLLKTESGIREKLMAAKEANKLDLFGVSIFAFFGFQPGVQDGKKALIATRLGKYIALDLCAEAGAGGKILPFAASRSLNGEIAELQKSARKLVTKREAAAAVTTQKETREAQAAEAARASAAAKVSSGTTRRESGAAQAGRQIGGASMKERILKVLETLRKFDAGRAEELVTEFGETPEERHGEFLAKVTESLALLDSEVQKRGNDTLSMLEMRMAKITRDEKIAEAKMDAASGKLVREHLDSLGRPFTDKEIDAEIKRVREAFSAYSRIGKVTSSGVSVGRDTGEKVQAGFDAMMGVKEAAKDPNVRAFRGLKEAYVFVTGDSDLAFGVGGRGGFGKVAEATVLTTDFPNLLLNSLTKRLLQDYAEISLMDGLDSILSYTDVADFKSQDRVRLGYLADLATVAEDAAYADFVKPTDERVTYAATKRGNTLPISRETILNDDLGKIAVWPGRIARAGRRTLKQFASNFFVNNTAYVPDGLAWFHATHANLGVADLSVDELIAREIALFNQTEKDSLKPLGLPLQWLMVSASRKAQAFKINQAQFYNPGPMIQEPNPFYQRFGANNERIIVNELLPVGNPKDWYYGTLPSNAPFVEIGFVQGVRQPQLFIQSDAAQGAVFTNDRITYKVRHEYGGAIVDFRGVGKNVVP